MGHFHLNCSVSGLTIGSGDVCVLIPLDVPKNIDRLSKDMYFEPPFGIAGAPLIGNYNEYGAIKLADGTEIHAMDGKWDTFAAVKGEVWDLLLQPLRTDWAFSRGINDVVLELLGFVETDAETGSERYDRLFVHPSSKDIYIASDRRWIETMELGKKPASGLYHVPQFVKWWKDKTGHLLDTTALFSKKLMYPVVEHELRKVRHELRKEMGLGLPHDILSAIEDARTMIFLDYAINEFGRMVSCPVLVKSLTNKLLGGDNPQAVIDALDQHVDIFCDLLMVQSNLVSVGLMLRPTVAGPQDGDYPAQVKYHSAIAAIAAKELAERDRELADDDEADDEEDFYLMNLN